MYAPAPHVLSAANLNAAEFELIDLLKTEMDRKHRGVLLGRNDPRRGILTVLTHRELAKFVDASVGWTITEAGRMAHKHYRGNQS